MLKSKVFFTKDQKALGTLIIFPKQAGRIYANAELRYSKVHSPDGMYSWFDKDIGHQNELREKAYSWAKKNGIQITSS